MKPVTVKINKSDVVDMLSEDEEQGESLAKLYVKKISELMSADLGCAVSVELSSQFDVVFDCEKSDFDVVLNAYDSACGEALADWTWAE